MTKPFFLYAFLISIFLHLFFGGALTVLEPKNPFTNKAIEITVLEEPIPTSASQQDLTRRQIVEQSKVTNELVDPKAKYLSRSNQKVIRETKAAQSGDFQNAGPSGRQKAVAAKTSETPLTQPKKMTLKDLLPSYTPHAVSQAEVEPRNSPTSPPAGQAGSQTSDHLKDVTTGLETMLNTREFVFYSYYDRIRGRLRQYWEPLIRDKVSKVMRKGRRIASQKDHITRIIITLNAAGDLIRIQVLEESGVHDLDEAAVEAFRAAAPFPNPPKGIISKDGTIQIRWDFVLES
jgi:protein TonB